MRKIMAMGEGLIAKGYIQPADIRGCKANLLLLLTAVIWGSAFVAQRMGMGHVGPFTYNGIRFALGAAILLPVVRWWDGSADTDKGFSGTVVFGGLLAGAVMFAGASFQQIGLLHTTAGKAAFITGLYVVMVPLAGLFRGDKLGPGGWAGAVLALIGLYLLSVTEDFTPAPGDLWELIGAFFWTAHVLILSRLSPRVNPARLACIQAAVCSFLSLMIAVFTETVTYEGLHGAMIPILYGGLLSVGVAYTLQVAAQRDASPVHAAIILSLEALFAALAGWLILDEILTYRALTGCVLMMLGMLAAQLWPKS